MNAATASPDELALLMQRTTKELSESREVNGQLIKQNKEMAELLKSVEKRLHETSQLSSGKENCPRACRPKATLQLKVLLHVSKCIP